MSFSCQDVLTRARAILSDEIADFRWDDPRCIRYVGDGLVDIYDKKPYCGYTEGDIVTTAPVSPTATGSTIALPSKYIVALAHFVAYSCLSEDSEDANNLKKAAIQYDLYVKAIE